MKMLHSKQEQADGQTALASKFKGTNLAAQKIGLQVCFTVVKLVLFVLIDFKPVCRGGRSD